MDYKIIIIPAALIIIGVCYMVFMNRRGMHIFSYLSEHLGIAVVCAIALGLIIGLPVVFIEGRNTSAYTKVNPNVVILTTFKKNVADNDWADNLIIKSVNGNTAIQFLLAPGIPAVYLPCGESKIVVVAKWSRKKGILIKTTATPKKELQVTTEKGKNYSLEYNISSERFVFEEYDNPDLFKSQRLQD